MQEEIKKSYNPFKMWGSWAGFVGGCFMVSLLTMYGMPQTLTGYVNSVGLYNPLILVFKYIDPVGLRYYAILSTPIIMFLYGWGLHSVCKKLKKSEIVILSIVIIMLVLWVGLMD